LELPGKWPGKNQRIVKSKEDGSKKEIIVSAGLTQPEDMAWDWVTRKLYFTDSGKKALALRMDTGASWNCGCSSGRVCLASALYIKF